MRGFERKKIKMGTLCDTRFGEGKVTGIALCADGDKYGIPVEEIFVDLKDRCVFDFDNGQRDMFYDNCSIILKSNVDAPTGNLFVTFDYFSLVSSSNDRSDKYLVW